MTTPSKQLQTLDVLVGTWDMSASIDGRPMGESTASFAWPESHGYLTMHVDPPKEIAPEWLKDSPLPIDAAIGLDDFTGGFAMLYADARGVCRIYRMTFDGRLWQMQGQAADGFHQRFEGTLDSGVITARWDHSADGLDWRADFDVTYRKQAGAQPRLPG